MRRRAGNWLEPEQLDEWKSEMKAGALCSTLGIQPWPAGESCVICKPFFLGLPPWVPTLHLLCVLQERGTRAGSSPLRVLERSIFSDRMVFVRAMHEAGTMEDCELELYDSW